MNDNGNSLDTLPGNVQETVKAHLCMLNVALPGALAGYYITGSVALGAYKFGQSDIDFIVVLNRRLQLNDIDVLKSIHWKLKRSHRDSGLDGFYITLECFMIDESKRPVCPAFNNGRYQGAWQFDLNSPNALMLKQYAICVYGTVPNELPFTVDMDMLLLGINNNLNTYWRHWIDNSRKIQSEKGMRLYVSPAMVQWGVLGISRLYYSIRERGIASKAQAGEYALKNVPVRWHRILQEALRLRRAEGKPQYRSIVQRRNDTLEYLEYMKAECESIYTTRSRESFIPLSENEE